MQKVIITVRNALTDLQLAIEGTIIMNEALRDTLNSIFDAKVPETWRRVRMAYSPISTSKTLLYN